MITANPVSEVSDQFGVLDVRWEVILDGNSLKGRLENALPN